MQESSPPAYATKPLAPYIGGKRNLAARLIPRLDACDHTTYVEPFVGMGGIFLRRRRRSHAEVINDISEDVACLFRILQRHYVAFMDMLRWQLTGRAEFDRLLRAVPSTLTDLERAARFLYLQRVSFGGKVTGRSFGVSVSNPGRFDITKLGSMLEEVHERLAGVIIERLPFAELIRRYDKPGTLFYLDPPYWGCEGDYGPVFTREDFAVLAAALAGLTGHFLLSINDRPEVRQVFAAFDMEAIETTYTISSNRPSSQAAGELLIAKRGSPLLRLTSRQSSASSASKAPLRGVQ